MNQDKFQRIAFVGNYLPRQCGIATFTTDLCQAVSLQAPAMESFAVAMNDIPSGYRYPEKVRFEINEHNPESYSPAADFLNDLHVDMVCLQHEFGIFGGPAGNYILKFLHELRTPLVTTLHTVLRNPNPEQLAVMLELGRLSDRLVVMSEHSMKLLQEVYKIPREKIDFIPHGIPEVPFVDPNYYKDLFGVDGKVVLLTFGLLSANKGIEYVIEALPKILKSYPNLVYILLGATHPKVQKHEGESYRQKLETMVKDLGLEKNVIFQNRFVRLDELIQVIGAADIYITPYLNREQSVSGTLAYTLGAGKAIVSTPYWYAEELLADERGVLVPFADPEAISEQVLDLLGNESKRHAIRKRAYNFGREMVWSNVAGQYLKSFQKAYQERAQNPRPVVRLKPLPVKLPLIKLNHLRRMTDDAGILQHSTFTVPNYREGYTTDDNARALALTVHLENMGENKQVVDDLANRYLAFLGYAFNPQTQRFRNFLSYERRWLEEAGSEDSHGRTLWALGWVLGKSNHQGLRGFASKLFHLSLPAATEFTSPRALAFSIFGLHEYLKKFPGDRATHQITITLAQKLINAYYSGSSPDWPWFEEILSYCNAVLPHALLLAGTTLSNPDLTEIGLDALKWLVQIQTYDGHFVPIGSNGFYPRGKNRARFDQQPVEAQSMISACLEAFRITGVRGWHEEAQQCFDWFFGKNDLGLSLYDPTTGGCRDGLRPDRVNQNQGAESTLAFLHSLLEILSIQGFLESAEKTHALVRSIEQSN